MPDKWQKILISPETTIIDAIKVIDANALQLALVVGENNLLLGTVSDGDIRRSILKGNSLNQHVRDIMYVEPTVAKNHESRAAIIAKMKIKHLRQIPIVDQNGRVIGLDVWDELIDTPKRDNTVLLMAGGLGSRLGELTQNCPKPLLHVGNKPVLETILENCKEYGFNRYYISVNYKANMVMEYFGDGSRLGIDIQYLVEDKRLGTAGALGILPDRPSLPMVVMNADVLTKINFKHLMDFHEEQKTVATMCVREYELQVPFGVVQLENQRLKNIQEKPIHRFFVNAGIYVLNPEAIAMVPRNEHFDMPSLFEQLLINHHETSAFPIREYWLDIGRTNDFEKANDEYGEVFS